MRRQIVVTALALAAASAASGCALAAGAAAGAGAAEYVSQSSPSSSVLAGVDRVAVWTRQSFQDLDIRMTRTETEDSGQTREFDGEHDDDHVKVSLRGQPDGSTSIDVTAKRNTVEYDKAFARQVLTQILSRRGV